MEHFIGDVICTSTDEEQVEVDIKETNGLRNNGWPMDISSNDHTQRETAPVELTGHQQLRQTLITKKFKMKREKGKKKLKKKFIEIQRHMYNWMDTNPSLTTNELSSQRYGAV